MRKKYFKISMVLATVLWTGCSMPNSYVAPKHIDTKLFVGECVDPQAREFPDLIGKREGFAAATIGVSVANSLLNQGLEVASEGLKRLGEDDVQSTVLRQNIGFFQQEEVPKCLHIVRGTFDSNEQVVEKNLDIELLYVASLDRSFYFIQPVTAMYKGHLPGESEFGKPRQLKVNVKHIYTGDYDDSVEIASFDFNGGDLVEGKRYIYKDGQLNGRLQSPWKPLSKLHPPYTIEVTLFETQKGSSFAKLLSRTFNDNQEMIRTEITKRRPFRTDAEMVTANIEAQDTQMAELETYQNVLHEAQEAVRVYKEACACSNGNITAELEALGEVAKTAQRKANIVGKPLGMVAFRPEELITETGCVGLKTKGGTNCFEE